MRTREEIEEDSRIRKTNSIQREFGGDLTVELLLDIRDLLTKKEDNNN